MIDLLDESRFSEEMESRVEPYLASRRASQFLTAYDGKSLYTESYAAPNPRGGVVIVHGFTETCEKFREMIWYFLAAGLNVFAYDGRGHGRSAREAKDPCTVHVTDFGDYGRDLECVVREAQRANGDLPLCLYAHSMGGAVGARYLEEHPNAFAKAVLTSPMIRPRTGGLPDAAARLLADTACRRGHGEDMIFIFRDYDGKKTFEDSSTDSRARYEYYAEKRRRDVLLQTTGGSWAWLAAAMRATEMLRRPEEIARIRARVLLLQSGRDKFVIPRYQDEFIRHVERGRIVRFPSSSHELYMTPNDVLRRYLDEVLGFLTADA